MLVPARLVLRRTARTHSALMSVSPLAARALRWAFRLTLPPLSHSLAPHTPGQK